MQAVLGTVVMIAVTVISGGTLTWAMVAMYAALNVGLYLIGQALAPKPKQLDFKMSGGTTVSSRQPRASREVVYGTVRKGGVVVFLATSGGSNEKLHTCIVLAGHQVQAINDLYLDGKHVPLEETVAGNGVWVPTSASDYYSSGDRSAYVEVRKHLGASNQAADTALIARCPDQWTADHKLGGVAYVYIQFGYSADKFPNGLPSISFDLDGKNDIYDPRDASTGFSANAGLCVANYLCDTQYGLGADYATEIDEDALIEAANIADEQVGLTEQSATFIVDTALDRVLLQTDLPDLADGTVVTLRTTGALPAPLVQGQPYYWKQVVVGSVGQLSATSGGAAIDITSAGSGTHTLAYADAETESRYETHGSFATEGTPADVLPNLLSSLGGSTAKVFSVGGRWIIRAAAYRVPDIELTKDDFRGPLKWSTLQSRSQSFNSIKGSYISPANAWQPSDFPPISDALYVAKDGGEKVWRSISLPFTKSGTMAQRIAKIDLQRNRREIAGQLQCFLSAYRLQAGDTVMVTLDRYGFVRKVFEVLKSRLVIYNDEDRKPALGVDLDVREIDANVFVWDPSTDQTTVPAAPTTTLPNQLAVGVPGQPSVTESLYVTRQNAVKAQADIAWAAASDVFVGSYQLEIAETGTGNWIVQPPTRGTSMTLFDVAPGRYDVRVKAISTLGVSSAYATRTNVEITGLAGPPTSPANLTLHAISGLAVLHFDPSPDLDVRIGGHGWIRWTGATSGATWENGVDMARNVPPASTQWTLPLGAGTYMMKWVDSSGVESTNAATVVTNAPTTLSFASGLTITESPTFGGVKTDCEVVGTLLQLTVDGSGNVTPDGSYTFADVIDTGGVKTCRLSVGLEVSVFNSNDQIDSRAGNVDDWQDWDGNVAAAASAQLWVAATNDDPAVTPSWGPWQRLNALGEFHARAYKFRLDLESTDIAYNIGVSTLAVTAQYD